LARIVFVCLLCLTTTSLAAQIRFIHLAPLFLNAASCQFNDLEVIDQRADELTTGIVFDGATLCKLQFYRPLPLYLKELFDSSTATLPKESNTLVIQLIKTSYTDKWSIPVPGFTNQFSLRLNLWVKNGNTYYPITGIDTSIITGSRNVAEKSGRLLSSFFEQLLIFCNSNQSWKNQDAFTRAQLMNLEEMRNSRFEINKTQQIHKGAYFSIHEFRNNMPVVTDYSLLVDEERFCELYATVPPAQKKKKVKVYSWVILSNGLSTGILIEGVLYPMVKDGNRWFFTAFTEKKQTKADMLGNVLITLFNSAALLQNSYRFAPTVIPVRYDKKEYQKILYTIDLFDGEIIPLKPI
jgi:hypothetical protein